MHRRQLVFSALLLAGTLILPACGKKSEDGDGKVKVACVGDSITFGQGIKQRNKNSYPAQLGDLLGDDFHVTNHGVSGTTLLKSGDHPYRTTKPYKEAVASNPDIVVIKLGSNDTKPKNWKHKDELSADLKEMVEVFAELPSKPKIFVCLPVPAFPERWGIGDSTIRDELIPILKKTADELGVEVIDLYKPLTGKSQHFPDKIHPNKDGAALIAKNVHAAIKAHLNKETTSESKESGTKEKTSAE